MVRGKKLLIVLGILTVSLPLRFLVSGLREVDLELPVKSLPDAVGEWAAVGVFVCTECQKELEEAVKQRAAPKHAEARIAYTAEEVKDGKCPIHDTSLDRTKDLPISFLVKKVLPRGTLFHKKWYRQPSGGDRVPCEILVTVVTSGKDRRSIHRPERCLPAQGWQLVSRDRLPVPVGAAEKKSFKPTRLVVQDRKGLRQVALYWFMSRNKITGSNLKRLLWGWRDRVLHGMSYRWSYALLLSPEKGSAAETSEEMAQFAAQLVCQIHKEE